MHRKTRCKSFNYFGTFSKMLDNKTSNIKKRTAHILAVRFFNYFIFVIKLLLRYIFDKWKYNLIKKNIGSY